MAALPDNPNDRDRSLELDVMREIEQIVRWRPPRPEPERAQPGDLEDPDDGGPPEAAVP
jgi:hypothetical protein